MIWLARTTLRVLVGICQFRGFTGLEIMAPETLGWPFDPVGMVQRAATIALNKTASASRQAA